MPFNIEEINKIIPPELTEQRKDRLRDGLKQFYKEETGEKLYTDFYSVSTYPYFLQGDLIREIRFPVFDKELGEYTKLYFDAILLSSTCDMDEGNQRKVPKNVIIAKLIPFQEFQNELLGDPSIKNAADIVAQVKNQLYSNILYLPPTINHEEYIAYLDDVSWISTDEISSFKNDIEENRIASLDFFGYYLFVFKLSYHLCRLPEETHR